MFTNRNIRSGNRHTSGSITISIIYFGLLYTSLLAPSPSGWKYSAKSFDNPKTTAVCAIPRLVVAALKLNQFQDLLSINNLIVTTCTITIKESVETVQCSSGFYSDDAPDKPYIGTKKAIKLCHQPKAIHLQNNRPLK